MLKLNLVTFMVLLSLILHSGTAYADLLCIKKTTADKTFSRNIRVTSRSRCPKGYKTLLNTTTFTGATGSQGASGTNGTNGTNAVASASQTAPAGNSNILLTTLAGGTPSNSTWYKVADYVTYTQRDPTARLKVSVSGGLTIINNGDSGALCSIQIRVDGLNAEGDSDSTYQGTVEGQMTVGSSDVASSFIDAASFMAQGLFSGASGTRTISLWMRGSSVSDCRFGATSAGPQFLIEELIF
jgi:hypothetical protein